jgi:hypothetical protein
VLLRTDPVAKGGAAVQVRCNSVSGSSMNFGVERSPQ